MEGAKKYLKLAAFVPAIVLVGGFVGYHAGAFELPWLSKPAPQEPATPQAAIPPVEQPPSPQLVPKTQDTFMPGSKSINLTGVTIGLTPAGTNTPDLDVPVRPESFTQPPPKPPAFMGGSKSTWIYTPPTPTPNTQ